MTTQQLPEGLAALPPGPELAAALASIDYSQIVNGDMPAVLRAQARQRAHQEAQLYKAIAEVGFRDPSASCGQIGYLQAPARYAADELRVALTWTARTAARELDFATTVLDRLPAVFAAWDAGDIDKAKAFIFSTYLGDLPAEISAPLCRNLLPRAPGWTTAKLAHQLRRLIIGIHPDHAADKYEKALAARGMACWVDDNGTATLSVNGLPPHQAAAAKKRIDLLARDLRRAGHPAALPHIRAELCLRLLDGTLEGLTRPQIIAHMLAEATDNTAQQTETTETPTDQPATTGAGQDAHHPGTPPGVDLRAELGTLLGHHDHPGELPDLAAPVLADIAREVIHHQRGSQWTFAVCDPTGYLLCAGITRARPDCAHDVHPGGAIELQIPADLLAKLTADPPPGWEKLVADIADQYAQWPHTLKRLDARPDDRFPNAALRRYTATRDRTCRGPGGCTRPARACECDHTIDHQHHGPTTHNNTGMECPHDHDLKDKAGWQLDQPEPGRFIWYSPLGQVYRSRGDPVITPIPELTPDEDTPPF